MKPNVRNKKNDNVLALTILRRCPALLTLLFLGTVLLFFSFASDAMAAPEISINDIAVDENGVNAEFTVTLSEPGSSAIHVDYATADGTASAPADYTATSSQLNWASGVSGPQTISVPIADDTIVESVEELYVNLSNATVGVTITKSQGTGTIQDNDTATISIAKTTDGNEAGPVNGVFTVTQSAESSTDTIVSYSVGGTATSGSDYTALSGSVTIPAGDTTATITVPVTDDSIVEATETVVVTLNSITSGDPQITIDGSNDSASLNISDNDTATFTIEDQSVDEAAGTLTFTISLDKALDIPITVDVSYADVTATGGGTDYDSAADSVTFTAGSTASQSVTVAITNDVIIEATETFTAAMSTATSLGGRAINLTDTATGAITDNDHTLTIQKAGSAADGDCTIVASVGSVSGAGGGTSPPNPVTYVYDGQDTVTLTAGDTYPSAGSIFKGWSGDVTSSNYTVSVAMDSDKTITATFNHTYTLTINMIGTGVGRGAAVTAGAGSPASLFPGGSAPGSYVYETGNTVTLTATDTYPPIAGCEFQVWNVDSGDPGAGFNQNNKSTTVTITGDLAITGQFIGTYSIVSAARENGSITPLGETIKYYGEQLTFTMTPDAGYVTADVVVDGFSQGAADSYTFTNISADHTIVAVFMLGDKPYEGPPAGDDQIYRASVPPLVLLVMGRNHKLYYEAYNDASDLNGDGTLDVGYNPDIDYYGYFDSYKVYRYDYDNERFYPVRYTTDKKVNRDANDEWSGDFLNYLTMSRIDVLRKVLYGGYRSTDTSTETVLMRSYIPQDAHSWGKEYESPEHDGYDIRDYTPLELPEQSTRRLRHLFANTTLEEGSSNNPDYNHPLLRVLTNSYYRIWEWVSIEGPVAGQYCLDGGGPPDGVDCEHAAQAGGFHPGHPENATAYQNLVDTYAVDSKKYDSASAAQIDGSGNPFGPDDNYLTIFKGSLNITKSGNYRFAVDGDDAVEVLINGSVAAGWYGGHAACNCQSHRSRRIYLSAGAHSVEFRHEEKTGGDTYHLYWRGPDSDNSWEIIPSSAYSGLTQTTYKLLTDETPASVMTDYVVKVKVCDPNLPETNSKKYPSGVYKPTGLLQKYGESGSMLFGLLSGSYEKNMSGGVLRKPIGPITDEINPNTGEFLYKDSSSVEGIIKTIDNLKVSQFNYYDHAYSKNVTSAWVTTRAMSEGEFPDWGNPIAEMMYEGLRYFAGTKAPTSQFNYTSTSAVDEQLDLPKATWDDPFETNDICSKAFMLVLTDINPTYDSDQLPGANSQFADPSFHDTFSSSDSPPADFDAESLSDTVSTDEGITSLHYIGQVNSTFDSSCNPKDLTGNGFGDIRGLCPEEPTKQGSYYAAGTAYFGRTHDMNPADGEQNVLSYIVALASPLPRIEIPVGDKTITLVPFAKSVGGCLGITPTADFQPTNTIVDFYVESLRPGSGTFRINYEDVEQGADHDMDAICKYEYQVLDSNGDPVENPSDGTQVQITLTSTYAAGCIIQHMGYVISGTSADGTYLEVRDLDTGDGSDEDYFLDTPPGVQPGDPGDPWQDGVDLPLVATRTFAAGETTTATLLKSPLWYAAKWGGFVDTDGNKKPNLDSEWDADSDGVPDTYFYVVNPLKLEQQLSRSFADIVSRGVSHVAPVVSVDEANRTQSGDKLYMAFFKPVPENYWMGNLKKYGLSLETRTDCGRSDPEWTVVDKDGNIAGECDGSFKLSSTSYWSTEPDGGHVDRGGVGGLLKDSMPGSDPTVVPPSGPYYDFRNIYTYKDGAMVRFIHSEVESPGITNGDLAVSSDLMRYKIINFMYGYSFDTQSSVDSDPVAKRDWILGDIIHSEPRIIDYLDASGDLQYRIIAVGANDGMIHFFTDMDATIGGISYTAGQEIFAFIPSDLLPQLQNFGDATTHTFGVDGAPNLYRYDTKVGDYYKKILVFGERRGGRSYWALDITNPDPSQWSVKWHIQGGPSYLGGTPGFEELGYSWSKPSFAKLDTGSEVKHVAIFSGGYDPLEDGFPESFEDLDQDGVWDDLNGNGLYNTGDEVFGATAGGTEGYDKYNPGKDNMGRGIFVVDLDDGSILFKATYGATDVTSGTDQKYSMMKYCFPADISVIPFSDKDIVMYAADVYGQIWKIRYDYFTDTVHTYDDPSSTRWSVTRIFTANPGSNLATGDADTFIAGSQTLDSSDAGRKTFYSPDVSYFGNEWTTYPLLYFGTGDRAHPRYAMISNRIYMITDDGTLGDETDLLNITCDELDDDADANGDGVLDADDDLLRNSLKNILLQGTNSVRGVYRVLDKQGDCVDDSLDHTGEKVLSQPTLFFENVYFTSYQPTFDDPCNPTGNAFVYGLNFSYFTAAFNYDLTNDVAEGEVRKLTDTYQYLSASSIPSAVKVITREGQAAGVMSAGGSLAGVGEQGSTSIPGPPGGVSPLLWKTE